MIKLEESKSKIEEPKAGTMGETDQEKRSDDRMAEIVADHREDTRPHLPLSENRNGWRSVSIKLRHPDDAIL